VVCGGASLLAVSTGMLRIVSTNHWRTDVLTGWTSGTIFGYVLPHPWRYRVRDADLGLRLGPDIRPDRYGACLAFRF